MNQKIKLRTLEKDSSKRIDAFIAEKIPDHSRSFIQKAIKNGNVEYEGKPCLSPKTRISPEKTIFIELPEISKPELPQPKSIPLDTIYEDNEIMVINKKAGMVVHPGDGGEDDTVVNALLSKFANFADNFKDKKRPGVVHRLDKDTSGCLIIAKNQKILEKLMQSFKKHEVKKIYSTLVLGHFKLKKQTILQPIGRHPVNRKKMAVLEEGGKKSITHYEVLEEGFIKDKPVSLLEVNIETGRTHQIRVHLSSIQHPVLGDKLYGGQQKIYINRQMLHAEKITIIHPLTSETKEIKAPVPEDMQETIDSIKKTSYK